MICRRHLISRLSIVKNIYSTTISKQGGVFISLGRLIDPFKNNYRRSYPEYENEYRQKPIQKNIMSFLGDNSKAIN
jgi:hypothetical protein